MNKLTGKAKEDFSYKYNMSNFNEYSEVLQNALVIEWLDSSGIMLNAYYNTYSNGFVYELILNDKILNTDNNFKTRQKATEKAIEQANILYNENNK